jgi:hypothetical protein
MTDHLTTTDVELVSHTGDGGAYGSVKCPTCGDWVATMERPWIVCLCSCGLRWTIQIRGVATN